MAPVNIDWVRKYCMSMPHATETVQWGDDLVFKVGGKMFAVAVLVPAKVWLSFKCSPEEFAELTERPGIIPAPYSARYHWVALETQDALALAELEQLLRQSYRLVVEKLPKKASAALSATGGKRIQSTARRRARRKAR
jgi:predicted DNA-binding protein (MmcQ/YjbR family)